MRFVKSRLTLALGENSAPLSTLGPCQERSSVGLKLKYQRPSLRSTIGRISQVHVSAEKAARWQPISLERLTPTGQCHDSGTLTLGRMWSPTHFQPPSGWIVVKM